VMSMSTGIAVMSNFTDRQGVRRTMKDLMINGVRKIKHKMRNGSLGLSARKGEQIVLTPTGGGASIILEVHAVRDSSVKFHIMGDAYNISRAKLIKSLPADLELAG
jgi:hypothetical protein